MKEKTMILIAGVIALSIVVYSCIEPTERIETPADEWLAGGSQTIFDKGVSAFSTQFPNLLGNRPRVHSIGDGGFGATFVSAPAPINPASVNLQQRIVRRVTLATVVVNLRWPANKIHLFSSGLVFPARVNTTVLIRPRVSAFNCSSEASSVFLPKQASDRIFGVHCRDERRDNLLTTATQLHYRKPIHPIACRQ